MTTPSDTKDELNDSPNPAKGQSTLKKNVDLYPNFRESTQVFPGIGMFEAVAGDVVLRGRKGHRDHIYPMHRAISRYYETVEMIMSMVKHGIRGWDTLLDINKDFKGNILEAIKQRRSLNLPLDQAMLDFEQKETPTTIVVGDGASK